MLCRNERKTIRARQLFLFFVYFFLSLVLPFQFFFRSRRPALSAVIINPNRIFIAIDPTLEEVRSYLWLGDYPCGFSFANSFFSSDLTRTLFAVVRPWTRYRLMKTASARVSKDCEANKPNAARRVVLRRTKRGLVACSRRIPSTHR